jgi:hypothetical protein
VKRIDELGATSAITKQPKYADDDDDDDGGGGDTFPPNVGSYKSHTV